jgi:hypothetical protein
MESKTEKIIKTASERLKKTIVIEQGSTTRKFFRRIKSNLKGVISTILTIIAFVLLGWSLYIMLDIRGKISVKTNGGNATIIGGDVKAQTVTINNTKIGKSIVSSKIENGKLVIVYSDNTVARLDVGQSPITNIIFDKDTTSLIFIYNDKDPEVIKMPTSIVSMEKKNNNTVKITYSDGKESELIIDKFYVSDVVKDNTSFKIIFSDGSFKYVE